MQLLCVSELILECGIKCKKVRCHAFIGGCKTDIIHRLLIECILKRNICEIVLLEGINMGIYTRSFFNLISTML